MAQTAVDVPSRRRFPLVTTLKSDLKHIAKGEKMKIPKESLFSLMQEGYITLQIPQFTIGNPGKIYDYPDEWFSIINSRQRPARGKETGFLYFSLKGWKANKDKIKKAFNSSSNPRGTWQEFEKYVNNHFNDLKTGIQKDIASHQKRLKELQALKI
jgi:hypothetical protein